MARPALTVTAAVSRFAVSWLVSSALAVSAARAEPGDMKLGSFGNLFCSAPATFDIQSQEVGRWVFHGKIRIRDTGEYDKLKIVQHADNSLTITRYLSGNNLYERQVVRTGPPRIIHGSVAVFESNRGKGVGCNNPNVFTELKVAD